MSRRQGSTSTFFGRRWIPVMIGILLPTLCAAKDWRSYGSDIASTKYSPLTQIDATNVQNLKVAWRWTSPDEAIREGKPDLKTFVNEATPLVIGGVLILIILFVIGIYNKLVVGRNRVKNAYAQIDVQLKRRHDLIPNLVETVKGYAKHENDTLTEVIEARSKATSAEGIGNQIEAENQLSGTLGRLLLVVEQYPDLKANENFLSLQEELTSTENRIGFARQHYNDSVMTYNTKLEQFPDNVIAGVFNFKQGEFFELTDEQQREAPQVAF